MRNIITLLLLIVFLMSCSKKEESKPECNTENPLEMEWIQNLVSELQFCVCTISVFQASFNGETVFWLLMNDPLCQGVIENISVFNCIGEEILILNNYDDWVNFNENVTNRRIIYVCPKPDS